MRRVAIFIGGVAVGLGLAVAILSPWKAAAISGGVSGVPGDVNGDGKCNVADPVYLLNYLFTEGPEPAVCPTGGGMLAATGQETCYEYDPRGCSAIDCAGEEYPGQDGFYRAGCPTEGRFVDDGDGTVTDGCTGLMWQKDTADVNGDGHISDESDGGDKLTWQDALKYCDGLVFAGHDDWRLPNIRELLSLVDYSRSGPAIDPMFAGAWDWYWSSSTLADGHNAAWFVHFFIGFGDTFAKSDLYHVRAVRGGLSR